MGTRGPDGVEFVNADMDHDVDQWRTAAIGLGTAHTKADGAVEQHPAFGAYQEVVGTRYLELARAVAGFVAGGQTATGRIADLIEACVAETTSRDDSSGQRVRTAGGGGAPTGSGPGGGNGPGGGVGPGTGSPPGTGTLVGVQEVDEAPLFLLDTDGDGRPDVLEDEDHDGVLDAWETGRDGTPRIWRDRDHDGRPDVFADLDGDGVADLLQDTDHDGTADLLEDRDGDGRYDVWEDGTGAPSAVADADADGVPDLWEDTDGDGVVDLAEDEYLDGRPDLLQQEGSGVAVLSAEAVPADAALAGTGSGEGVPVDADWQPGPRRLAHRGEWA